MQNKKLILLTGLGILALVSLLYGILTPPKGRRSFSSKPVEGTKTANSATPHWLQPERRGKRTPYETWGRNPFVRKDALGKTVSGLNLNGIAWDKKSPRAVINDVIVSIGDKIGGYQVVEIEPNRVILNDGVNDFELRVGRKK